MSKQELHTPNPLLSTALVINRRLYELGLTQLDSDLLLKFNLKPVLSPYEFEDADKYHVIEQVNRLRKMCLIELAGFRKTKKRPARLYCLTEKGSKVLADLVRIIEGR